MSNQLENLENAVDEFFYGIMAIEANSRLVSGDDYEKMDQIAARNGCLAIGRQWREIPREEAAGLITNGFAFDLVFTTHRETTDEKAAECCRDFLAPFSDDAKFFTSVSQSPWEGSYSNASLTPEWTYDCGVAVSDAKHTGFICFVGED